MLNGHIHQLKMVLVAFLFFIFLIKAKANWKKKRQTKKERNQLLSYPASNYFQGMFFFLFCFVPVSPHKHGVPEPGIRSDSYTTGAVMLDPFRQGWTTSWRSRDSPNPIATQQELPKACFSPSDFPDFLFNPIHSHYTRGGYLDSH